MAIILLGARDWNYFYLMIFKNPYSISHEKELCLQIIKVLSRKAKNDKNATAKRTSPFPSAMVLLPQVSQFPGMRRVKGLCFGQLSSLWPRLSTESEPKQNWKESLERRLFKCIPMPSLAILLGKRSNEIVSPQERERDRCVDGRVDRWMDWWIDRSI